MKKKVLYGVAMALAATASMGTLQSCKDDLSDFKHQYAYDQDQLDKIIAQLQAQINACHSDCAAKIAELKAEIEACKGDHARLEGLIKELQKEIANRVTLDQLNAVNAKADKNAEDIVAINTLIGNLSESYNNRFKTIEENLATVTKNYDELLVKVNTLEANYNNQQEALNQMKSELEELINGIYGTGGLSEQISNVYNAAMDEINALNEKYDALYQSNEELWQQIFGTGGLSDQMSQMYNALNDRDDELEQSQKELWEAIYGTGGLSDQISQIYNALNDQYMELQAAYDNLIGRMDALITGILLQATDSPVFGNFSLPIGVQSNLLFNWYGSNNGMEFNFPSSSKENSYDVESPVLTAEDLALLATAKYEVPNGYLGDVNLGRVYLTVNPIGHNFDATKFALETSAGARLPYEIKIDECNDELSFGYNRSAANGFYSADVIMPANAQAIDATKITIDEGLKTAVKDILKDRTKRNAVNLLKAVYHQLDGMLPAYAMRYDWTVDNQPYSVLSKYDLAVATAKPLSYKFYYGQGEATSHRLPTFGHLDNIFSSLIDKDKFKFHITTTIKFDKFTVDYKDIEFNFNDFKPEIGRTPITITIPSIEVKDSDTGEVVGKTDPTKVTVTVNELKDLYDAVEEGIKDAIDQLKDSINTQINQQIRDNLIAELQKNVDDVLDQIKSQFDQMIKDLEDDINGQISDMIDDVINSIENKMGPWYGRINRVIDLYNKVANKINNFIADPNNYLQVAMFYKGNGTVGLLSNKKSDPTVFVNGGGNTISLYASSYTAEIVCPAYKKFVAVTNVYNPDGTVNAAAKADIPAINAASALLNKVVDGNTIRVGVNASKLKKGLTYEIVYQGLDYSGVTSTQKFYIKVK